MTNLDHLTVHYNTLVAKCDAAWSEYEFSLRYARVMGVASVMTTDRDRDAFRALYAEKVKAYNKVLKARREVV